MRLRTLVIPASTVALLMVALAIASLAAQTARADATITVTTTLDEDAANGDCSLREAIIAANTNSDYNGCTASGSYGADTITLSGATYTLTLGELPYIESDITIQGVGAGATIIDADGSSRHFSVGVPLPVGGNLTLNGVTLQNGSAENATEDEGGSIYVYDGGTVTIIDSELLDNEADYGGAVYIEDGSLTVTNSTLTSNSATLDGGAIYNEGGTVTIEDGSVLSHNWTDDTSDGEGGAIYNDGELTITGSTLADNWTYYDGGAILNYENGTLTVISSAFTGNGFNDAGDVVLEYAGAIENYNVATITDSEFIGNSAYYEGGAIYNYYGPMTITDSTLSGNGLDNSGEPYTSYGGAIYNYYASLDITGSTLSGNVAYNYGGAIYNDSDDSSGALTITDSTLSANGLDASGDPYTEYGGAIYNYYGAMVITGSTLADNAAYESGGAIYNESDDSNGALTITDSILSGNGLDALGNPYTSYGGAIYNYYGPMDITGSTLSGNGAYYEGGAIYIYESVVNIIDSALVGNEAAQQYGGAIENDGTLTITGSTLSGNTSGDDGGAIENYGTLTITNSTLSGNTSSGIGGALDQWTGTATLVNVTFSGNSAADGGGAIFNDSTVVATNVLIANSTGGGNCVTDDGTWGGASGSNLSDDASCPSPLFFTGDDGLGPLANNGGLTLTHLPGENSAAIDAADATACPATDQRGVTRPQGDACDIGSVEVEEITHDLAITKELRTTGARPGDTVRYDLTVTDTAPDGEANAVVVTDRLPDGTSFVGAEAPTGWTCDEANGRVTCTAASMAANTSAVIVLRLQLADDAAGRITNEASVSADDRDPDAGNNTDSASFTVLTGPSVPQPDITPPPTAEPTDTATATPSPTAEPTETPTAEPRTYTYDLSFRWTLITWYGADGASPAEALGGGDGIVALVTALFGWDGTGQSWLGYFPDAVDIPGANDLTSLQYGQAYWIAIDNPDGATWTIVVDDQFEE